MEITVGSPRLAAQVITAHDASGREHLVVVAKATWSIPDCGERPRPLAPQPLVDADQFVAGPGESALLYGSDLVRFKPRCDVLFNASAHSPTTEPVRQLKAGFKIGNLRKLVNVIGSRTWRVANGRTALSEPAPFVSMPLHYGLAFGGTRTHIEKERRVVDAFPTNPVGVGWSNARSLPALEEEAAPSLESLDDPIRSSDGSHRPIALSGIARHWQARAQFAGTYDEHWQREVFPFFPEDFDEQFHQCAPADQQMDYPDSGEHVVLLNLIAGRPRVDFTLPRFHLSVRALRTDYSVEMPIAAVDTLYFEPDERRFSAVWRASIPIHRHIDEFSVLAIGPVNARWWAAKQTGQDANCAGCDEPGDAVASRAAEIV